MKRFSSLQNSKHVFEVFLKLVFTAFASLQNEIYIFETNFKFTKCKNTFLKRFLNLQDGKTRFEVLKKIQSEKTRF